MSVENQCEETTTSIDMNQQEINKPTAMQEESMDTAAMSTSQQEQLETSDGGETGDEVGQPKLSPKGDDLRAWFEGLSSEERAASLGFIDEAFLAAFLAMVVPTQQHHQPAPPSSSTTSTTDPLLLAGEAAHVVDTIDWGAMISIEDVESAYDDFEKTFVSETTTDVDGSTPGGDAAIRTMTIGEWATTNESGENRGDSDAFRIRNDGDRSISSDVRSLLGQLCVIFPSAFKQVSGDSVIAADERCRPCVCVNPMYVGKVSYGELILALDAMGHYVHNAPFLSKGDDLFNINNSNNNESEGDEVSTADATRRRWLRAIANQTNDSLEVPLCALFLARLELAVFESYRSRELENRSCAVGQLESGNAAPPSSSSVAAVAEGTGEAQSKRETKGPATTDYLTPALENESSSTENQRQIDLVSRTAPLGLIRHVMAQAVELKARNGAIDSETLAELMGPFTESFLGGKSIGPSSHGGLHNLLLTPLHLLARPWKARIDFRTLDNALGISLKKVSDHVPTVRSPPGPQKMNAISVPKKKSSTGGSHTSPAIDTATKMTSIQASPPVSQPARGGGEGAQHSSPQKKKKKKKKKSRPQRKAQNGDSAAGGSGKEPVHVDNKPAPAPAPEPTQKKAEEKAEEKPPRLQPPPPKAEESQTAAPGSDCKIASPRSTDSEETEMSTVVDAPSVKSDGSSHEGGSPVSKQANTQGDMAISRVEGGSDVAAAAMSKGAPLTKPMANSGDVEASKDVEADGGDTWETVGRGRGSRKKATQGNMRAAQTTGPSSNSISAADSSHAPASKKGKSVRRDHRKKHANRKMAKDIVNSVLDSVEEEVRKRRRQQQQQQQQQQTSRKPAVNPWKSGPPSVKAGASPVRSAVKPADPVKKEPTLRDVVLGRHTASSPKQKASTDVRSPTSPKGSRRTFTRSNEKPKNHEQLSPSKGASRLKAHATPSADQNTAPTYQETVSAVSTYSNVAAALKGSPVTAEDRSSKNDTSSTTGTDEAPQNRARASVAQSQGNPTAPVPPLPTLLSPENANSANSSVASSLEVPHSSRQHHHNSAADVNDVGYHLLDVCDRLSRDMSLFMSKRALALNSRRRERGALMAALQDTVASLWPGRGHVEMYGSCATNLDLPSSDLDVVIMGVDRNPDMMNASPHNHFSRSASMSSDAILRSQSADEISVDESQHSAPSTRLVSLGSYAPVHSHGSSNAERVVRLGAELEAQPWAVQVNAIPTAYVPVIKVLADPSKLTGSSSAGDEWLAQHQQLEAQAGPAPASDGSISSGGCLDPRQHYEPPWRGADVMNGLLKLDITFDGPEHGGIGSTQFSARVVADACQEAAAHPDATVLVQVVMVLKEILAQRKLNEPYSGGLSSYGLLLLVLALLQDRAVIREEIERAELQRKAMVAGDGSSSFASATQQGFGAEWSNGVAGDATDNGLESGVEGTQDGTMKASDYSVQSKASSDTIPATDHKKTTKKRSAKSSEQPKIEQSSSVSSQKPPGSSSSSWASVAKKNPKNNWPPKDPAETKVVDPKTPQSHTKPPTFADAVARSVSSASSAPRSTVASLQKEPTETDGSKKKSSTTAAPVDAVKSEPDNAPVKPGLPDGHSRGTGSANSISPSLSLDTALAGAPSFYPQGYNDVIEVLCAGETTAGKLLMHFLLFYGQHFDAQSTAIDLSGKHERHNSPFSYYSPYILRHAAGRIDPVTGMLTVDPIVIYDPLEGAENSNVARRCFAWGNVRWVFAQSYATLSSAVERSATPPATPGGKAKSTPYTEDHMVEGSGAATHSEAVCDIMDPSSPLLSCLLSF